MTSADFTTVDLPASIEAERAILGGILADHEQGVAYEHVAAMLKPEDFSLDSHRRIYLVMGELSAAGKPIAGVEMLDALRASRQLEMIGGAAYLFDISEGALPTPSYLTSRAKIVKEKARRRQLIEMCATAAGRASDRSLSLNVTLDSIQEGLLEIAGNQADQPIQSVLQISDRAFNDIVEAWKRPEGQMIGLPTAFDPIDWDLGGICPGELWVIGGRPGEGKSSLATQIAVANCQAGVPVLFFTIEMTDNQLLRRIWCQVSNIPPKHWKDPRLMNVEARERAKKTMLEVAQWPLFVDSTQVTSQEITARIKLAIRRHGIKLVIVDYAQLVDARARDERERLTKVSRSLAQLAKETTVPVILLSQMPRPIDRNLNRRPTKYDLKESGSLEADASVVLLIFREVDKKTKLPTGADHLILAKAREGQVAEYPITFLAKDLRYVPRVIAGMVQ